jgi:hypothetical protein
MAAFSTVTKTATDTILLTLSRQLKGFGHLIINADEIFGTHNGIGNAEPLCRRSPHGKAGSHNGLDPICADPTRQHIRPVFRPEKIATSAVFRRFFRPRGCQNELILNNDRGQLGGIA